MVVDWGAEVGVHERRQGSEGHSLAAAVVTMLWGERFQLLRPMMVCFRLPGSDCESRQLQQPPQKGTKRRRTSNVAQIDASHTVKKKECGLCYFSFSRNGFLFQ